LRTRILLIVIALASVPGAPAGTADSLTISSDLRIAVELGRQIELHVLGTAGDDYGTVATRVAGGSDDAEAIAACNGRGAIAAGEWVRVPIELLAPDYRRLVLTSLFPEDRHDGGDWIHVAQSGVIPTYDEGLWDVAEWFTGRGDLFREIMRANGVSSPELARGQRLRVPATLLHDAFGPRLRGAAGALEFHTDSGGPYAAYRLKAGEALYSSVIVQFTGRTGAEDVQKVAELLLERSGLRDARDIPVGFPVKIPLELLEPEFLPEGHPRRLQAEAERQALARELERKPVAGTRGGLEGVVVIIDSGHGGRDLGTMNNGIWEHDYVYDVACRLKQKLERETSATVLMTLRDDETGYTPSKTDKLKANRQGTVLTDPTFLARENGEAVIGVNLRWYLANSMYRRLIAEGTDPDRVVFLSLHADSRHPSLRGIMVYVPGATYRARTYGNSSKSYNAYREVNEKRHVSFSTTQRVRSEAVSRKLAESIVAAYDEGGLPVQPHQPVRGRIIRGQRRYVPAVIRGNMVPTKVLVEIVNLSNPEDAALLASARDRDRLAGGLVRSLFDYFGEPGPEASASTARR